MNLETLFCEQWTQLGGRFYRARSAAELAAALAQVWRDLDCDQTPPWKIALSMQDSNLAQAVGDALSTLGPVELGPGDRDWSQHAALGVTDCAWAVADTGSVALVATETRSLLPSLLPPAYLVIIRPTQWVPTVDRGLAQLRRATIAPLVKLVTGPSMTADIEGQLVRGVHGPGRVAALVYESV